MAQATFTIEYTRKDRERVANYLYKHAMDIIMEVGRRVAPIGYKYALKTCQSAVDAFYGEFGQNSYHRTNDLHNAYDVGIRGGWDLRIQLGADLMEHYHHQGNDFVYENSFVGGFHGGSAGTDKRGETAAVPYWRTPAPQFTFWYPSPAPRGTSPYKTIVNKLRIYDQNVYTPLYLKELGSILNDIRERLGV